MEMMLPPELTKERIRPLKRVEYERLAAQDLRAAARHHYGLSQVDEYWIVNHVDSVIEVYREPRDGTWQSKTIYQRGDRIAMLAFPDVTIAVSDVLPPA